MNNKSNLALATFIFLAACSDNSSIETNSPDRVGSVLEPVAASTSPDYDEFCPVTCEIDYECCPEYQEWYEASMELDVVNPGCELACCPDPAPTEKLVCEDEILTSK